VGIYSLSDVKRSILSITLWSAFASLIAHLVDLPLLGIITWVVTGCYHELGHTLAFWLGSIPAIPFFMIMTFSLPQFGGIVVFLILLVLAVYFFLKGKKQDILEVKILSGLFVFLLTFCTWIISDKQHEAVSIMGGLLGESLVSALVIFIALSNFPDTKIFIQYRYLFAFTGPWVLVGTLVKWTRISLGFDKLPYGAMIDIGGAMHGKSDGDIDRLLRDFHFTEYQLKMIFTLGAYGAVLILLLGLLLVKRRL
jgi:hypothetical protein